MQIPAHPVPPARARTSAVTLALALPLALGLPPGLASLVPFTSGAEPSPARPADKPPPNADEQIDRALVKLQRGFMAGDFTPAVELLYGPLVEKMGGRDRALAAARGINEQMKARQVGFLSWQARKPYQYLASPSRRYAIVPTEARLRIGARREVQGSYLLGIERPGGRWEFINGDKLNPQVYEELFPDFPKGTALPKVTRTVE